MGSSVLWRTIDTGEPVDFPQVPWAMEVVEILKRLQEHGIGNFHIMICTRLMTQRSLETTCSRQYTVLSTTQSNSPKIKT